MRDKIDHQVTTENLSVYDTVGGFRLTAMKPGVQLRQKQQNTMGGQMVA